MANETREKLIENLNKITPIWEKALLTSTEADSVWLCACSVWDTAYKRVCQANRVWGDARRVWHEVKDDYLKAAVAAGDDYFKAAAVWVEAEAVWNRAWDVLDKAKCVWEYAFDTWSESRAEFQKVVDVYNKALDDISRYDVGLEIERETDCAREN